MYIYRENGNTWNGIKKLKSDNECVMSSGCALTNFIQFLLHLIDVWGTASSMENRKETINNKNCLKTDTPAIVSKNAVVLG